MYSRKKASAPELVPIQGSDPSPENKVTVSNPYLQTESENPLQTKLEAESDLNLPIAIRKRTRECT